MSTYEKSSLIYAKGIFGRKQCYLNFERSLQNTLENLALVKELTIAFNVNYPEFHLQMKK